MPDPELPDPGLDPDLPGPGTDLADELRALGRSVVVAPVPDDLAERVLARVPRRRPHPVSRMLRRTVLDRRARRRLVAVVVAALLVGLLLTPPVRAAVVEWFRVGGILFSSAPAPTTAPTTRPTTAPTGTGSDDPTPASPRTGGPGRPAMVEVDGVVRARDMVDFPVALPDGLGEPTRVAVAVDHRLVELEFRTSAGPVLLSQFDGSVLLFVKRNWDRVERVDLPGGDAFWLAEPHTISYVDADGVEHADQARVAGPTLAYQARPEGAEGPVTVRIEGVADRDRAIAVAASLAWR